MVSFHHCPFSAAPVEQRCLLSSQRYNRSGLVAVVGEIDHPRRTYFSAPLLLSEVLQAANLWCCFQAAFFRLEPTPCSRPRSGCALRYARAVNGARQYAEAFEPPCPCSGHAINPPSVFSQVGRDAPYVSRAMEQTRRAASNNGLSSHLATPCAPILLSRRMACSKPPRTGTAFLAT